MKGLKDSLVETNIPNIEGSHQLVEWLGAWPSFHDAEILEMFLTRRGISWMKVCCPFPARTSELRNIVVTLKMTEVFDLDLKEFNHQNVIFDLQIQTIAEGYSVELFPCFGLSGFIKTKQLSIESEKELPTAPVL